MDLTTRESGNFNKLLVIVSDRLSDIVKKGEVTDRYYNPGDLFQEVHILMCNDDRVELGAIKRMAGGAKLYIHNLPTGAELFLRTLGWQKFLLKGWLAEGILLARQIKPDLVRCYNDFVEGYLARSIKNAMGVPYVVSLHGVWDKDCLGSPKQMAVKFFRDKLERATLEASDGVIAVYKPIIRYAEKYGAKNVRLIYNAVADSKIGRKEDYTISAPVKLITVNRQLKEKNPENIIRAIKDIDCVYTIVGDGEYHGHLEALASAKGCVGKIRFIKAISNDRLCSMLKDFDIMVSHCDYWGISKTTIEASLAGLPIVVNRHPVEPIPEYDGGWLALCENSPEGYGCSIKRFIADKSLRERYGKMAYENALNNFGPGLMEKKVVDLYAEILNKKKL
ncbi:MAG: glycosyltransferase [Candidatus Omnitrophota bacterium]